MDQHKDTYHLNQRKATVEKTVKALAFKREKTLYLYEIERQSRKRKNVEQQLRVLLEYETKDLQQAQRDLQEINNKLEREKQKHTTVKVAWLLSILMIVFAFAGLVIYHHDGNNALTGAVVGIPSNNCHEEITCVNETITTCENETAQRCDNACVNETTQICAEECKPQCHTEKINGVEREVCTKSCTEVCTGKVMESCGSCVDVVEERCSSEVVEQCTTQTICDESSDITGGVSADIVEEVPEVGIQPIVEEPVEVPALEQPIENPGSEELDVQPIKEEIPDEMTGGAITIPEEEPALEVPPVAEESPELEVPAIEEPVVENPPVELEEPSEEEVPEVTEPIETVPEDPAEEEMPEEPVEEIAPAVVEEKSIFSSIVDSILEFIFPEDLQIMAITRLVLNTTYVTQGNANVNLTAQVDGTDQKYIYNWLRNDTPIAVLHMTFDGGSDPANARDYSGRGNRYNSSFQGITIGYVSAINFSVRADRCNGATNADEWDVNGSSITNFDAVRSDIFDSNTCVAAQDGYLGSGFIMYTKENVSSRFTAFSSNHEHFIYVNFSAGSGWRYDSNTAWTSFTPLQTDVLVAQVNSNLDTRDELGFLPNKSDNGYNNSKALVFDGIEDYVNISNRDDFNFTGRAFSVAVWVKTNTSQGNQIILAKKASTSGNDPGYFLLVSSSLARFALADGGGGPTAKLADNASGAIFRDNNWHHWVGVFNGSMAKLYIDGELRANSSEATVPYNTDNNEHLYVGKIGNGLFFNGTLDEVMIFNRSLSEAQIYALWRNQTNTIVSQEVVKGEKWTVEVTPNTGTADGTMSSESTFIYQPVIQSLTLNSTNIATNDTTVNLTAYAVTADADGDSVKVIYNWLVNGTPIAVLNMPFEGINGTNTNNAWDYSGLSNYGNVSGATWNATGGHDSKGAYQFDGINDHINLSNQNYFESVCNDGCTFTSWVKWGNRSDDGTIIGRSDPANDANEDRFFTFRVRPQGTLELRIFQNGSNTPQCIGISEGGAVEPNNWRHVAGRYNGTHTAVFVNGTQMAATSCSFSSVNFTEWQNSDENTFIGANSETTPGNWFNGTIDDVLIFNRSLSNEQIYALWRNQTDVIVAQETGLGQNWTVQATPNDGFSDGTFADGSIAISNVTTILNGKPAISTLVLNSTNITSNNTHVNLTAYSTTSDVDGDSVKVIYNWLKVGSPIAVLNMPFEKVDGTDTDNARDYSGLGNNGSENGGVLWNASGGHDSKGAYMFDGNNDYINLENKTHFRGSLCIEGCTFAAWVKKEDSSANGAVIIARYAASTNSSFAFTSSNTGRLTFVISQDGNITNTCQVNGDVTQLLENRWQHAAAVYNKTHTSVYLNGTNIGATACSFSEILSDNWNHGEKTFIGARRSSNPVAFWNGTIDEVMVFNRSLSAEQIYTLWRNQTNVIVAQETVVGENWAVQATPNDGYEDGIMNTSGNMVILNTKPVISTLVLNSTNVSSNRTEVNLTAYNTTTDFDGDSVKVIYNWLKNATPIAVLNMPFEGINGTAYNNSWDYSGKQNHGNESGGIVWNATAGYDGKGAYEFDGLNDYIDLGDRDYFKTVCNNGCTFSLWASKYNKQNQVGYSLLARKGDTNNNLFFQLLTDSVLRFTIYQNGTQAAGIFCQATTDLISPDIPWQHVVGRYNGTHTALFINGTQKAVTACAFSSINSTAWQTSEKTFIGATTDDVPETFWNGTLDDVMIFNRSLSPEQIYSLWQNKTDVIVAQETNRGENWAVQATPNDGYEDGIMNTSGKIDILNTKPVTVGLTLNTTNLATNSSTNNLTAYFNSTDADNDVVKNITNWKLRGLPFAAINLPFEANGVLNGTDYGGFENNISSFTLSPVFLPSGGYGGSGAYNFSPADEALNLNATNFPVIGTGPYTVEAWIKTENGASHLYQNIFSVNNFDPGFYVTGTSGLRVYQSGDINSATTTTITDANWHHVAFVRSGTTLTFYLDGASYGTATHSGAFPTVTHLQVGWDGAGGEDFHGTIDELKIYNYSLTAQQINAHFNNKTTIIVSQELRDADVWSVEITPHDGVEEGTRVSSNNVTIQDPPVVNITIPTNHSVFSSGTLRLNFTVTDGSAISNCWYSINNGINTTISCANLTIFPGKGAHNITVYANDTINLVGSRVAGNITVGAIPNISVLILNTTNLATNDTNVNLTAYPTTNDGDSDSVKIIYNWYRNDTPLMVLNMPFEQLNGTNTSNAKDYTGLNPANKIAENGGPYWNQTGGHDGKGAYNFDGTDDFISISNESMFDLKNYTYVVWFKADTTAGFQTMIDVNNDLQILGISSGAYALWGRCGVPTHGTAKTDVWSMLSWSVNGSTYQLYENATLIGSGTGCSGGVDGSFLNIGAGSADGVTGNEFFDGHLDDVKIFNVSLTAEQISALYLNRTNEIASTMTEVGDNWTVHATPNDGYDDGNTFVSNNVTILATATANSAPSITALVLNTTNISSNRTEVNLTAYVTTSDADGDSVKVIYNWLRNNTPIAVVNMPFEKINDTTTDNAWDYSGYRNNGSDNGGVLWNATGGFDGKGAYQFDGINDEIKTISQTKTALSNNFTLSAWIKPDGVVSVNLQTIMAHAANWNFRIQQNAGGNANEIMFTTDGVKDYDSDYIPRNGSWYHVAIVLNSSNDAVFYVNGTAVKTSPGAGAAGATVSAGTFCVGAYNSACSARFFNGTIDEVMVFNRTLSAEQIWALSKNQTNIITAQETGVGDNWTVQATPNDATVDGGLVSSNNVTILAANTPPPAPVLISPINGSTTTSRTPTFIWNNSVDADSDPNISYRLEIDDNIGFTNPEVNVSGILNTTNDNTTYTISTELAVDTTFFWRVFAYDQTEYGINTSPANFTVQSYLAINITDKTAAFGTLPAGANVSTPNNASPLRAENVGNIIANITVTGTSFFNAVSMPSTFYRFRIRANESGAFNTTASATEWNETNTTLGVNIFHVINLDWHSISNDFLTDLNISVPLNESAGSKKSTITFTITG